MIVSRQSRLLFVHVQKTGGSTIARMLREALPDAVEPGGPNSRHIRLPKILNEWPETSDYWTFGFVRNPWARLLSWHSMVLRDHQSVARINPLWRIVPDEYQSFDDFILRGLDDDRLPMLRRPQISYLHSRNRIADFIGRQESFDVDMRAVFARIGVEPPAEVARDNANPSPPGDYRDAYTAAARDKVGDVFERDVRSFGYTF